jgi:integrase
MMVTRLIEAARNQMHRTILMLLYGTGMRRTEASRLKVSDIDSQRMVIDIHSGKGLRDRDVPLTPKLLVALRDYWRWKKPRISLFPSKMGDPSVEHRQDGVGPMPGGGHSGWHPEETRPAHAPILLRHTFAGGRHRSAHHPVIDGA